MLLNPSILYAIVWFSLIILYQLRLSNLLLPLDKTTFSFLIGTIVCFLLGWAAYSLIKMKLLLRPTINLDTYRRWLFSKRLSSKLRYLTLIFSLGYLAATLQAGNLPLLSLLGVGKPVLYSDFGIPTLHGLSNACYLVVFNILFCRQILKSNLKTLSILMILFAWPILAVTRQLFMSIAIDSFFLYALIYPSKILKARVIITALLVVFIFGYVGNLRSDFTYVTALLQPRFPIPSYLPSGLLWLYAYITTPINNVINNSDTLSPSYFPIELLSFFLPSFVRENVLTSLDYSSPQWNLVNPIFNVSSMHQSFLMDFGFLATPILYFLISFFATMILHRSKKSPRHGLILITILHGIVMSVFHNLLFHLVFIFKILIYLFYLRSDSKSRLETLSHENISVYRNIQW